MWLINSDTGKWYSQTDQLPKDNFDLCKVLGIQRPLLNTVQTYGQQDISVKVI